LKKDLYNSLRNIFFDTSAFPRAIFIPFIKMLFENENVVNLFVLWTNKKGLIHEKNVKTFGGPEDLPGFIHLDPEPDDLVFWLPILSYNTTDPIELILEQKHFKKNKIFYPLLTFPTQWPDETNQILLANKIFFDKHIFKLEKIRYVPYNNPFEFFFEIKKFFDLKQKIYGEKFYLLLSPLGSKAQSIGACLSALNFGKRISFQMCKGLRYEPDTSTTESDTQEIESFVAWIKMND